MSIRTIQLMLFRVQKVVAMRIVRNIEIHCVDRFIYGV